MRIADRTVAAFHYTLTDDAGAVIDSSQGSDPLTYLHGKGHIVPGLEQAMVGRAAGDKFQVSVAPEEGYGAHDPEHMIQVPREALASVPDLAIGMQIQANSPQGTMIFTVAKIEVESVTLDGNHPLAGQTLHFDVEVMDVREASVEEVLHGHVHGPGSH